LAIDCNYGNTGLPGYAGLMKANVWLHTMPDIGSRKAAIRVLKIWDAWDLVDESIRTHLLAPSSANEVLRQAEFEHMDCRIFGLMPDKLGPLQAAMEKARELGYTPQHINPDAQISSGKSALVKLPGCIVSLFVKLSLRSMLNKHVATQANELEASAMGRSLGHLGISAVNEGKPLPAPCALFFTGEMLVTVGKGDGIGGRDQECALSAAGVIQNQTQIVIGSVDTDGTDGPGGHFDEDAAARGITTLAGGIVDGCTLAEAAEKKVDIAGALKNHGTSAPLWKLDCGIWATQNISVQDLAVVLVMPAEKRL
jgi:glycerate-2-kinase